MFITITVIHGFEPANQEEFEKSLSPSDHTQGMTVCPESVLV